MVFFRGCFPSFMEESVRDESATFKVASPHHALTTCHVPTELPKSSCKTKLRQLLLLLLGSGFKSTAYQTVCALRQKIRCFCPSTRTPCLTAIASSPVGPVEPAMGSNWFLSKHTLFILTRRCLQIYIHTHTHTKSHMHGSFA